MYSRSPIAAQCLAALARRAGVGSARTARPAATARRTTSLRRGRPNTATRTARPATDDWLQAAAAERPARAGLAAGAADAPSAACGASVGGPGRRRASLGAPCGAGRAMWEGWEGCPSRASKTGKAQEGKSGGQGGACAAHALCTPAPGFAAAMAGGRAARRGARGGQRGACVYGCLCVLVVGVCARTVAWRSSRDTPCRICYHAPSGHSSASVAHACAAATKAREAHGRTGTRAARRRRLAVESALLMRRSKRAAAAPGALAAARAAGGGRFAGVLGAPAMRQPCARHPPAIRQPSASHPPAIRQPSSVPPPAILVKHGFTSALPLKSAACPMFMRRRTPRLRHRPRRRRATGARSRGHSDARGGACGAAHARASRLSLALPDPLAGAAAGGAVTARNAGPDRVDAEPRAVPHAFAAGAAALAAGRE